MIIVTGAAGFIGSNLIAKLNAENFNEIVAVDDFSKTEKEPNLSNKKILKHLGCRRTFIKQLISGKNACFVPEVVFNKSIYQLAAALNYN